MKDINKSQEIIKIADIHAHRIRSAIKNVQHLFPIKSEVVETISENDLVWLDFLINRFGKLQDMMGAKLIDFFLEAQQENADGLTILDKINKLERLGIIENAELWKEMRTIRNHLDHEYPDEPELTAKYLNEIFNMTPSLLSIFENIKKKI